MASLTYWHKLCETKEYGNWRINDRKTKEHYSTIYMWLPILYRPLLDWSILNKSAAAYTTKSSPIFFSAASHQRAGKITDRTTNAR